MAAGTWGTGIGVIPEGINVVEGLGVEGTGGTRRRGVDPELAIPPLEMSVTVEPRREGA